MDSDYQLLQPLAWERLFLSLQQKMQQELLVKQKLAYLKRLVETYYESGDAAFAALLDEPEPMSPEFMVASCLKGEADEKTSTIDLAKKRLAAGLQWHASGIF